MFTGIIQALGHITDIHTSGSDATFEIEVKDMDLSDVKLGDSIAINGTCLTVVTHSNQRFTMDVSGETLACTMMSELKKGDKVNIERALLPTTRLDGHIVSGHVDGIGQVTAMESDGRSKRITIAVPESLKKYIVPKGSVCIDGISLTVNRVNDAEFEINIIPHTQAVTIIGDYHVGRRVNIEIDIIARYLERLLVENNLASQSDAALTADCLKENGYM